MKTSFRGETKESLGIIGNKRQNEGRGGVKRAMELAGVGIV